MPDQLYTVDRVEAQQAVDLYQYVPEGDPYCFVMDRNAPLPGAVPLLRYYNQGNHFYTTDQQEGAMVANSGYAPEGAICLILNHNGPQLANTTPFYRWNRGGEHFYTIDPTGEGAPLNGFLLEGSIGYVYTSPQSFTIPLLRLFRA
jgi:hypothetical protein